VVVALVVQLLLNMLGIGLGVATLDLMTGDRPELRTFSIFAAIWWTVCDIIVQPGTFADPLTEVWREGARALLAQALEAEVSKPAQQTRRRGER
jgi:hypothetical protein